MLNWVGSPGSPTTVKLWFVNQGKGVIKLYEAGNPATELAEGMDSVSYDIPAGKTSVDLVITTAGTRPPPGDIHLMMDVKQGNATLPAFEGTVPANGAAPYGPAAFKNTVPNGSLGRFDALVIFP